MGPFLQSRIFGNYNSQLLRSGRVTHRKLPFLRIESPRVTKATRRLLERWGGLLLGVCDGGRRLCGRRRLQGACGGCSTDEEEGQEGNQESCSSWVDAW
jgi:hypothetical protein